MWLSIRNAEELKRADDFLREHGLFGFRNYFINSNLINSLEDIYNIDGAALRSMGIDDDRKIDAILKALDKETIAEETLHALEKLFIDNGFEEYIPLFKKEKAFSVDILKTLTSSDLVDIGIETLGERKRLCAFFETLGSGHGRASASHSSQKGSSKYHADGTYSNQQSGGSSSSSYANGTHSNNQNGGGQQSGSFGGTYYSGNQQQSSSSSYDSKEYAPIRVKDQGGCLWWFLGFIVPFVIDLIIYLILRDTKPKTAHDFGWGAVWSYIGGAIVFLLTTCAGLLLI